MSLYPGLIDAMPSAPENFHFQLIQISIQLKETDKQVTAMDSQM